MTILGAMQNILDLIYCCCFVFAFCTFFYFSFLCALQKETQKVESVGLTDQKYFQCFWKGVIFVEKTSCQLTALVWSPKQYCLIRRCGGSLRGH
jgi:hypothetical protein